VGCGQAGALDGGEQHLEPPLGVGASAGLVRLARGACDESWRSRRPELWEWTRTGPKSRTAATPEPESCGGSAVEILRRLRSSRTTARDRAPLRTTYVLLSM
jgi:hypothetical protein